MFHTHLSCFPWDLVDEGIDAVLDRLQGEVGITGINVTVATPGITQFRPRSGVTPRIFTSSGGLQFQPHAPSYAATRVRPVVADWLRKSNPLNALAESCAKRKLALRGSLTACLAPTLADKYPHGAVKDAFGNSSKEWLCPANPDVREYLRALFEDLSTHYAFEAVELEHLAFPDPARWSRNITAGIKTSGLAEWLLSLCFCESCRQLASGAGIEAAAAARSVTVAIDRILGSDEARDSTVREYLDSVPVLAAYVDWQRDQLTALLGRIRAASRSRLAIHHDPSSPRIALDSQAATASWDALLIACPATDADEVEEAVQAGLSAAGNPARIELGLSACSPACPDATALVRATSRAAALGTSAVSIANYGLLPPPRLQWVKQAVRYALREAGS